MATSSRARRSVTRASFHPFSQLPLEIRVMIWKEALPGPRIVYVKRQLLSDFPCRRVWSNCAADAAGTRKFFEPDEFAYMADHEYLRKPRARGFRSGRYGFRPEAIPITLLYVCRESFAVASSMYTRILGTKTAFPETWIDLRRDILYIDSIHSWVGNKGHLSLDVKKVEHLAVRFRDDRVSHLTRTPSPLGMEERYLSNILDGFYNLKTVTLLNMHPGYNEHAPYVLSDYTSVDKSWLFHNGLDMKYNRGFDKEMNMNLTENQGWWTRKPLDFSTKRLDENRTAGLQEGQPPRFALPVVKWATIISLEGKVMYDILERDYLRKKDRFRTTLRIRSIGQEDLKLAAREMMTMGEVVKEFCHSRNISNSIGHAKIMLDVQELNQDSTVYDLNLMSGDKLDIVFG